MEAKKCLYLCDFDQFMTIFVSHTENQTKSEGMGKISTFLRNQHGSEPCTKANIETFQKLAAEIYLFYIFS